MIITESMRRYAAMSKAFMNNRSISPEGVVGHFDWHEKFPYEKLLLADKPDMENCKSQLALDFGCGPGRMVRRMNKLFARCDGVDISSYMLESARASIPESNFYESSGYDCGDAPKNTYDFVFCTISLQHIPVRSIRQNIYECLAETMKTGARFSFQVTFHESFEGGSGTNHQPYEAEYTEANATNGFADFTVTNRSLPLFIEDLSKVFRFVRPLFYDVREIYTNLDGAYHQPSHASHWLFMSGVK